MSWSGEVMKAAESAMKRRWQEVGSWPMASNITFSRKAVLLTCMIYGALSFLTVEKQGNHHEQRINLYTAEEHIQAVYEFTHCRYGIIITCS